MRAETETYTLQALTATGDFALADWLRSTHGAKPTIQELPGLPNDFYQRPKFVVSEADPTRFVAMRRQPEWLVAVIGFVCVIRSPNQPPRGN